MTLSAVRWKKRVAFGFQIIVGLSCFFVFPWCWGSADYLIPLKPYKYVSVIAPLTGCVQPPENGIPPRDVKQSGKKQRSSTVTRNFARHVDVDKVKTEMCRSVEKGVPCIYGDACQFAHSMEELRPVERSPQYKTALCRNFHAEGQCPFGQRCHFIHDEKDRVLLMKRKATPFSSSSKAHSSARNVKGGAPVAAMKTASSQPPAIVYSLSGSSHASEGKQLKSEPDAEEELYWERQYFFNLRKQLDQWISSDVNYGREHGEKVLDQDTRQHLRNLSFYYLTSHRWVEGFFIGALLNGIAINYVPSGSNSSIEMLAVRKSQGDDNVQDAMHLLIHLFLAVSDPKIHTVLSTTTLVNIRDAGAFLLYEHAKDAWVGVAAPLYRLMFNPKWDMGMEVQSMLTFFAQQGYVDEDEKSSMLTKIKTFIRTLPERLQDQDVL